MLLETRWFVLEICNRGVPFFARFGNTEVFWSRDQRFSFSPRGRQ